MYLGVCKCVWYQCIVVWCVDAPDLYRELINHLRSYVLNVLVCFLDLA